VVTASWDRHSTRTGRMHPGWEFPVFRYSLPIRYSVRYLRTGRERRGVRIIWAGQGRDDREDCYGTVQ
jgi:hypothetical protein